MDFDRPGPARPPIRVRGARAHNLQQVDLDLPVEGITLLLGPSGSGKSSLALDVLHAAGRQHLARVQGEAGAAPVPADLVDGLPITLAVEEGGRWAGERRLVDLAGLREGLASLAARLGTVGCPDCGRPLPCTRADQVAAELERLPAGSAVTLMAPLARARTGGIAPLVAEVGREGFARVRLDGVLHRVEELPIVDARLPHDLDLVVDRFRVEGGSSGRLEEAIGTALAAGRGALLASIRAPGAEEAVERAWAERPWCPLHPRELSPPRAAWLCREAELARVEVQQLHLPHGPTWPQWLGAPLEQLSQDLEGLLRGPEGRSGTDRALLEDLLRRFSPLLALGLGELPLDRPVLDLAGGERSRAHLARALGVDVPGLLLILDEPVAGLDAATASTVAAVLREVADRGTHLLVVDHRPELLRVADRVVAFGPGAGRRGGRVVWQGPATELPPALLPESPAPVHPPAAPADAALVLRGARGRNLDGVDLRVPASGLLVLTGGSGSGRSSLLMDTLVPALRQHLQQPGPPALPYEALDGAGSVRELLVVDRRPLGRSPASCVATVLGLWTPLRELLAATREARILGMEAARFRLDRAGGRCEACQGSGLASAEARLDEPCPECGGARFQRDVQRVRLKGRSVAGLLALELDEAARLFGAMPRLAPALLSASRVGLGYLALGQPSASLSGGEAQRLRLALELARTETSASGAPSEGGRLLVLDGPTIGLHPEDTARLVEVLRRVADRGTAVVAITDDPLLVAAADWEQRL